MASRDFDISYSPIPADHLQRQNVLNYIERERPLEVHKTMDSIALSQNNDNSRKKREVDVLYSYIKRPCRGPRSKLIRLQIFELEELNNVENMDCINCEADTCAQYIVDYTFSDEVYKCAKDLLNKMHRKLI